MGKVLSGFPNGWAGAISRSVDDIVEAHANVSGGRIPFGAALFQDEDCIGVTGISADSEADSFIGFAVRSPAKTPNVYSPAEAASLGAYEADEMVDVLTRGSIVLLASGGGIRPGGQVYINRETGRAVAAPSASALEISNCHFRTARDANDFAEVVLLARNLI